MSEWQRRKFNVSSLDDQFAAQLQSQQLQQERPRAIPAPSSCQSAVSVGAGTKLSIQSVLYSPG